MKIEFIPALPLSHPPVPGLHPPDEPGAFLFQDVAFLNQAREPLTENARFSGPIRPKWEIHCGYTVIRARLVSRSIDLQAFENSSLAIMPALLASRLGIVRH
jgi:hypothetical protein